MGRWRLISLHFNVPSDLTLAIAERRLTFEHVEGPPGAPTRHTDVREYDWLDGDARAFRLRVQDSGRGPAHTYSGKLEGRHLLLRTDFEPEEMLFERVP